MKIVVAAAGRGTRMGELTKDKPKHLIDVHGQPFLYYVLENIKKAGFDEIIVVGGYCFDQMQEFINSYDKDILLVDQAKYILDGSYGTVCPIKSVRYNVMDQDFVFLSGDNLFSDQDLARFKDLQDNYCYVGAVNHDEPENFGVVNVDNNMVAGIEEKPKKAKSNLINASLYKFTPEIFNKIRDVKMSSRGEYELTDAINLLALEDKVKVVELKDYWYDFGRPEEIKSIEKFLKK